MLTLNELISGFRKQHQHKQNVLTHQIGIPAMMMGILIFLSWITIGIAAHWHIAFSWLAVAGVLTYYYRIDVKVAAAMTVMLVIMTLLAVWIGYPKPTAFSAVLFVILFFGGLAAMLVGHSLEKSEFRPQIRFCQFLAAPLFLLIEILKALKLCKYFDLPKESHTDHPHP